MRKVLYLISFLILFNISACSPAATTDGQSSESRAHTLSTESSDSDRSESEAHESAFPQETRAPSREAQYPHEKIDSEVSDSSTSSESSLAPVKETPPADKVEEDTSKDAVAPKQGEAAASPSPDTSLPKTSPAAKTPPAVRESAASENNVPDIPPQKVEVIEASGSREPDAPLASEPTPAPKQEEPAEEPSPPITEEMPPATPEPVREEPPAPSFDIRTWIATAQGYATGLGLHLDSSAVDCWDDPIVAGPHCLYLERDIQDRLSWYASQGDITDVWIWAQSRADGSYDLYIGYA